MSTVVQHPVETTQKVLIVLLVYVQGIVQTTHVLRIQQLEIKYFEICAQHCTCVTIHRRVQIFKTVTRWTLTTDRTFSEPVILLVTVNATLSDVQGNLYTVRMPVSAHCADAFLSVSFSGFYRAGVRRLRPVRRPASLRYTRSLRHGGMTPVCGSAHARNGRRCTKIEHNSARVLPKGSRRNFHG